MSRLLSDVQLKVILDKRYKQMDDLRIIAETQDKKTYQDILGFIKHYVGFEGKIWDDKYTTIPYGVRPEYQEINNLLDKLLKNLQARG